MLLFAVICSRLGKGVVELGNGRRSRELRTKRRKKGVPKPQTQLVESLVVTESRWEGEERREKAGSQPAGPRERLRIHCAI